MRKDRDSNPGTALGGHTLSRRASSATRASFQSNCKYMRLKNKKQISEYKTCHFVPVKSLVVIVKFHIARARKVH